MKVTGIIAEYNPFHNGHEYHIKEAKRRLRSDYVVVVMSGNFVQRGAPTILDKFSRTEMALASGADLVLELPACYATASAEYFAYGGVAILDKLGVVDDLCFGTESLDSKNPLSEEEAKEYEFSEEEQDELTEKFAVMAKLLIDEPKEFKSIFKEGMKNGLSYAAARSKAIGKVLGKEYAEIIDTSNNILGVEYMRSIIRIGSSIKPEPIPRMLTAHHDVMIMEGFSSASAIRNAIFNKYDFNSIAATIPKTAFDILMDAYLVSFPIFRDDFSIIVGSELLKQNSPEKLASFFGIKSDLANRIYNLRNEYQSFSQFRELISTKNSNKSTASRALMHIALGTKKKDMKEFLDIDAIKAVKVLGFRKESQSLLKEIKKKSDIHMVTKLADYKPDNPDKDMICRTTRADMIYRLVAMNKFNVSLKTPYEHEVIIVE